MQIQIKIIDEASRQVKICNSCRYCEGLCPVFPAMTEHREFNAKNITYLANLCHNCQACYYACQYSEPHQFKINIPQVFNEVRKDTFIKFSTPNIFAGIFKNSAIITFLLTALFIALTFILAIHFNGQLFAKPAAQQSFFKVIPLWLMNGIPLTISAFVVLSIVISVFKYIRFIDLQISKNFIPAVIKSIKDIGTLNHHFITHE